MSTALLLATRNKGKLREFRALLGSLPELHVVGLDEVSGAPEVIEDGATFEANACKKARETAAATGLLTLADDSGLEVDALSGAPGVHSARYAGRHGADEDNNEKLLRELAGVADAERTARYRVVLALADPKGPRGPRVHTEVGSFEGQILRAGRGQGGFGYDPLFQPEGYGCSLAELSQEEKNRISHRALAVARMVRFLETYLPERTDKT